MHVVQYMVQTLKMTSLVKGHVNNPQIDVIGQRSRKQLWQPSKVKRSRKQLWQPLKVKRSREQLWQHSQGQRSRKQV